MQGLMQMAQQDPFKEVDMWTQRLESMGYIAHPNRTTEDKTVEQFGRTLDTVVKEIGTLNQTITNLATPIVNAVAENVKNDQGIRTDQMGNVQRQGMVQQQQPPQPQPQEAPSVDKLAKLKFYQQKLGGIQSTQNQ